MRWFLALLLLTGIAIAQSQQPDPPISEKNQTRSEQQKATPDQRGTEQKAFVVQPLTTEKSADETAREAKVKENSEWWTWFLGVLTIAALFGQLIVFIFQAYFLKGTLEATKNAALRAKDSADALMSAESASLFVIAQQDTVSEIAKAGFYDKSESMWTQEINLPGIAYAFRNLGRTAAIIRDIGERVTASPDPPDCISPDKFTVGDAVKFQKEKLDIWFNGWVRYEDAFRRAHRLTYLFRYHRGYGRFRLVKFSETIEKPENA
jgi:hypothetical protein